MLTAIWFFAEDYFGGVRAASIAARGATVDDARAAALADLAQRSPTWLDLAWWVAKYDPFLVLPDGQSVAAFANYIDA